MFAPPQLTRVSRYHKISLAIVAAFALQTGYAEDITVNENETYTKDIVATDSTTGLINHGTVDNGQIVLKGGTFENYGSVHTGTLDLQLAQNKGHIKGDISAEKEFIFRGLTDGRSVQSTAVNATIHTKKLSILGTFSNRAGLEFYSSDSLKDVGEIYVESKGQKTGFYLKQTGQEGIRYDHTVRLNSAGLSEDARIEAATVTGNTADAYFYVDEVVSESLVAKSKLQITNESGHKAVFEIGNVKVERGYLNLQTYSSAATQEDKQHENYTGTFVLHNVELGKNAKLRAAVWGTPKDNDGITPTTQPPLRIEGNITVDMAAGSSVDFGGWESSSNHDWMPSFITLAADSLTINIADSNSKNYVYLSKPGLDTKPENIHVIAAASNNTGNAEEDLGKLADIVKTNYKDEANKNHLECLPGVQLEQLGTDILDGAVGEVGEGVIDPVTGDCINCGVTNIRVIDNPNIHGIAEMTSLGLHIWRNEIDEMHRRMGELRDSSGYANGLWTRVYNGKASFGGQNITNKYTAFQFGYDHQASPGLWLGGAVSYTYGDNDFANGGGENSLLAFTAYASRLYDNGIYLDFTGKVGRMKNSFDIRLSDNTPSSGDYHTNAVSVSAEAGWRFYPTANVFLEPQLELWYGHVFDAQYQTSTNVSVDQDSTDSLVGRAGLRFGIKCPQNRGSAFIKASVLHDWEGEAGFRFSKGGQVSRTITEDLGGTWYEYGIGADLNATDQLRFWAELERGEGGEVDTDYRATIGMRYTW